MVIKTGLGQDSHKFDVRKEKPFVLGGIEINFDRSLSGNSDADVVLHALTNAVSSITGKNIIGAYSDKLCREQSITDSAVYLEHSLSELGNYQIIHIAISIECKEPLISPHIERMKKRISELTGVPISDVGITATSGEGLTEFGKGNGIQAFVIITVKQNSGK
ncbi:MAG TPA: 2-C-methyl-D-erythritol 2,4-cyclodiphosphate synthase [Ignavibacteria bacterium]|nr:2-C-methyl-D-erythritol 2,4-cyclodiphosphate synthase [Ignavibacteria bacterium]